MVENESLINIHISSIKLINMENRKIRVAITHGDTNGIGYELIFKTFEDPTMLELCTPIVYGSPKVAAYHRKALDTQVNFTIISHADEAHEGRLNLLPVFDEEVKVDLGVAAEESANAGLRAIDRALEDFREGCFDVLVNAPLDNNDVFHFSGQSRYVEDHLDMSGKGLSVLLSERLRVALATRNLPIRQVAESITKEMIKEKVRTLSESLRRDFRISSPRVAVLALNPKAGDNGLLGTEEQDVIAPAIAELAEERVEAFGPYAADSFFGDGSYAVFDGILAMYFDQALAPFHALTSEAGVLYTAGLSLVRTAPDMGVSMDIAGKGVADAAPMRQAIYDAIDIFRNRVNYDEPLANPLKKLYKEKRDESEKVRFAVPKPRFGAPKGNKGDKPSATDAAPTAAEEA